MLDVRNNFPVFANNSDLVYLDSAATSLKPQVVIDAERKYYEEVGATVHRGVYDLSQKATEMYEGAREIVREFINAKSTKEIIFTRNATESINLVASSLAHQLDSGDVIVVSEVEHHSNIVPWQALTEQGIILKYIPLAAAPAMHVTAMQDNGAAAGTWKYPDGVFPVSGELDMKAFDEMLTPEVKLVCVTHMSNVTGIVNDVKKIIKKAHAVGALVLVDGAQSVAHIPVDVQDFDADFFVFSGHKMLGPTGTGVLYGKQELLEKLPPFLKGGDMILGVTKEGATWNELPWKFEAGTPNIAGVIGLGAAIKYLQKLGMDNVWAHEQELMKYGLEQLIKIEGVKVLGGYHPPAPPPRGGEPAAMVLSDTAADNSSPPVAGGTKGGTTIGGRGAIFSFTVDGIHPHDIGSILNSQNIAIRAGHHCAMPLHQAFGIPASARASCYVYNTKEDIDALVKGIAKVKETFA